MKKSIIILLMAVLLPLLCNAAHQSGGTLPTIPLEDLFQEQDCARQRMPLDNTREYTDTDVWCLLQVIHPKSNQNKWHGSASGSASDHPTQTPSLTNKDKNSSHLPHPTDGGCVFIKLHHLII